LQKTCKSIRNIGNYPNIFVNLQCSVLQYNVSFNITQNIYTGSMVKLILTSVVIIFFAAINSIAQIINPLDDYSTKRLQEAKEYYNLELLSKTKSYLNEALHNFQVKTNEDEATIYSSLINYANGNYSFADITLKKFIQNSSNSPYITNAAILRAYIAFEQKDYEKSAILFDEAEQIIKSEYAKRGEQKYQTMLGEVIFWHGNALALRGKYKEANEYFTKCFTKYPNSKYADDALFALGMSAEVNLQYEVAIDYFRSVRKKYPYSNSILVSMLREVNDNLILRKTANALITIENANVLIGHIQKQDSIGARYEKQSYMERIPEELLYLRGEAYNQANNYEQAASFFSGFLETFTNSYLTGYVRLSYGWALLNMKKYKEAADIYQTIIDSQKDNRVKALAKLYLAITYKRMGERDKAQEKLSNLSASSDYPYLAQALLELAQIYYENAEYEKAIKTLKRAEREATEALVQTRIQLLLGASNIELKQWNEATAAYEMAIRLALKSNYIFMPQRNYYLAEARLKLGIALVKGQHPEEAIKPLLNFISNSQTDLKKDEALFWLSEAYYRSNLLNNAIETYKSLLNSFPSSKYREESLYGLGWSYFRLKKFDKASATFEQMISQFPNTKYGLEVLTRQGDGYYVTKNYAKAVQAYRKAAQLSPSSDEGQYSAYQLAHALYQMKSYEEAITALFSFVRTYPKSPYAANTIYLTGWIRFQQNRYNEAIDHFKFLIEAYPNSNLIQRTYFAIADAYYNMQDFENALSYYKIIFTKFPNSSLIPEAVRSMQYCYNALGKPDEALKIADQYVETNPKSPYAADFVFHKGEMFYSGKKYGDAISEYDNFIKKFPGSDKSAEAFYWMGKSYVNIDDLDNAEKSFNKVIKEFPKSEFAPLSILELGSIKKQQADLSAADSLFKILMEKYPANPISAQAGYERAMLVLYNGDTTKALNIFNETGAKFSDTEYGEQCTYKVAMYFLKKGWLDSAITEFRKLSHSNIDANMAAEALYRIGEIYKRKDDCETAITEYTKVRENFAGIEDWFTLAMLNMGECYEKLGDIEKAIETYQSVVTLRPDDDFGKTAKRRINELEKKE